VQPRTIHLLRRIVGGGKESKEKLGRRPPLCLVAEADSGLKSLSGRALRGKSKFNLTNYVNIVNYARKGSMKNVIHEIGESLVHFAVNTAEFSKQRGLTEELFPYIYQASRRMSTRAISQYLNLNHKVKISAVSIAKALREADKHWESLYEEVEPAARIFGDAHGDSDAEDVLELDGDAFRALCNQPPTLAMNTDEQRYENYSQYENAMYILRDGWFAFDEDTRQSCLVSIRRQNRVAEETEGKDDEQS
jgi:hypothetical protein